MGSSKESRGIAIICVALCEAWLPLLAVMVDSLFLLSLMASLVQFSSSNPPTDFFCDKRGIEALVTGGTTGSALLDTAEDDETSGKCDREV